jgi:hypothetical protein
LHSFLLSGVRRRRTVGIMSGLPLAKEDRHRGRVRKTAVARVRPAPNMNNFSPSTIVRCNRTHDTNKGVDFYFSNVQRGCISISECLLSDRRGEGALLISEYQDSALATYRCPHGWPRSSISRNPQPGLADGRIYRGSGIYPATGDRRICARGFRPRPSLPFDARGCQRTVGERYPGAHIAYSDCLRRVF